MEILIALFLILMSFLSPVVAKTPNIILNESGENFYPQWLCISSILDCIPTPLQERWTFMSWADFHKIRKLKTHSTFSFFSPEAVLCLLHPAQSASMAQQSLLLSLVDSKHVHCLQVEYTMSQQVCKTDKAE